MLSSLRRVSFRGLICIALCLIGMAAIAIGAEKETNPPGHILVQDNSFANDTGIASVFVRNYTGRSIEMLQNRLPDDVMPLGGPELVPDKTPRP